MANHYTMSSTNWPYLSSIEFAGLKDLSRFPKISIITPSYNQGQFIEETILSVLSQEYPNLEYIIIDGGSTDNTVDIIRKYEDSITYWISEKDRGQAHALNKGMEKVSGEIIGYLNSDDCLLPYALFKVAKAFLDHEAPLKSLSFFGQAWSGPSLSNENNSLVSIDALKFDKFSVAKGYGICPQPSTFWTKNNIYFDESLQFCMDIDYWFKLAAKDYKGIKINDPLSFCRTHPAAKSTTMNETMWLELSYLTFKHSSYVTNIEDKLKIVEAFNYKYRIYLTGLLKEYRRKNGRTKFLQLSMKVFKVFPQLFLKLNFVKFIVKYFIKSEYKHEN